MAVYTQVPAELLGAFLARYDVGSLVSAKGIAEGVENSNFLVETTRNRFILTLYEKRVEAADLPYFMALLDHLAAKGLPVPPAVKDRDGREVQELAGRPACLIRFLPGVSLSYPTAVQARNAGEALARMHLAAADFPLVRPNSLGIDTWRPLYERCGAALDGIRDGLHAAVGAELDEIVQKWPGDLPRGTIHADLFPDNVLVLGDRIAGLIDFYFACTDLRAYDLAVMHTSWSFDDTGQHAEWAIGDALIEGYQSLISLSAAERDGLGRLVRGACVRFLLSRAWDWLNTPADALVTRKDPMAYWRRLEAYRARHEPLA
jgi:homoserine kinase type II